MSQVGYNVPKMPVSAFFDLRHVNAKTDTGRYVSPYFQLLSVAIMNRIASISKTGCVTQLQSTVAEPAGGMRGWCGCYPSEHIQPPIVIPAAVAVRRTTVIYVGRRALRPREHLINFSSNYTHTQRERERERGRERETPDGPTLDNSLDTSRHSLLSMSAAYVASPVSPSQGCVWLIDVSALYDPTTSPNANPEPQFISRFAQNLYAVRNRR